ncbi:hypothetical protein [Paraburkholderia lycopersici]|uniref:hypothetical protein n=1 Tax=Paraburkholderia lycopersici TaxID=416944 RepID=UPI001160E4A4|nr:hypothetical protein [Paraburkholderia lycopersici]
MIKKALIICTIIAAPVVSFAWLLYKPDSEASECVRATSPDGRYIAERCVISWNHLVNPLYLGRVYDSKTGELLVRRRFNTPAPEVPDQWWDKDEVLFSRGGDEDAFIHLPPTLYDRLMAHLP